MVSWSTMLLSTFDKPNYKVVIIFPSSTPGEDNVAEWFLAI